MLVEAKIEVDNLGSRFVKMEGLKKPSFEIETPFARFLTKALEVGVYSEAPRNITKKDWERIWGRMMDIMIISTFGKAEGREALEKRFSEEEIGKEIFPAEKGPITRERVRQLLKEGTRYLYQASSDDLKQQYPDLLNQKEMEYHFMVRKPGPTRAIAGAILQGATYQDLVKRGFSSFDLFFIRRTLSNYGLEVPDFSGKYQQLQDDLRFVKTDDPPDTKQRVLDRINRHFMSRFEEYRIYYLTISDLAKMTNLHFFRRSDEHKLILQVLSEAGINQSSVLNEVKSGKQKGFRYTHIILTIDKDRALVALRQDPRLEPLRREVVKQICGGKVDQLPTTGQLVKGEEYRKVGSLLRQLGLRSSGTHFSMESLLVGCPVPVFKTATHYCYSVSVEQPLLEFLRNLYSH